MDYLHEILRYEEGNNNCIYLYPQSNGSWIAYARSAINLHRILHNIPYREKMFPEYGVNLPFMIIDPMSLQSICNSGLAVERSDDRVLIRIGEALFPEKK